MGTLGLINTIALLSIAGLNVATAYLTFRARDYAKQTQKDMQDLEKNTNSKMDSLLKLTAKSARAEGRLEAKDDER